MIRATSLMSIGRRHRHRLLASSSSSSSSCDFVDVARTLPTAASATSSSWCGDDDRRASLVLAAASSLAATAAALFVASAAGAGLASPSSLPSSSHSACRCDDGRGPGEDRDAPSPLVDMGVDVPFLRTISADSPELLDYGRRAMWGDDGRRSGRAHARAVRAGLHPPGKSRDNVDFEFDLDLDLDLDGLLATSDGGGEKMAAVEAEASIDIGSDHHASDAVLGQVDAVRRRGLGRDQVYTKRMYFYQCTKIRGDMRDRFRLFALPSSENLGREMAYLLSTSLNLINVGSFADGETSVKIEDIVRGKEVYVVCSTTSTNSILELLLTISALRRGSAKRICAVIPYYGYSRQDRRTGLKREPIAAADVARLLEEMGVDSVICCDLHNPLVKGFFRPTVPVDHLMPGPVAAAYFYEELFGTEGNDDGDEKKGSPTAETPPKITVVAAHENQVFRANAFRSALQKLSGHDDIRVALISNTKGLSGHDKSDSTTLVVGDVRERKCIIIDDIINTGGQCENAIDMVYKSGASEIYAWATHGVFHLPNNDAPQKIQDMDNLKYLLVSNSVVVDRELPPKIRKLSIAPLLAESVARSLHSESISTIFSSEAPGNEK
ncbi:hypothetical protein ACHAXA_008263 [Cyclostephanos tholiformis]|uniref:ribose-phosphate diphosphokinase n=1 Tax=Cyclostephanos tholiformis TaxID=382380 RepID=A0ABD3R3E9_9STRA